MFSVSIDGGRKVAHSKTSANAAVAAAQSYLQAGHRIYVRDESQLVTTITPIDGEYIFTTTNTFGEPRDPRPWVESVRRFLTN